jgi:hypothetical protein
MTDRSRGKRSSAEACGDLRFVRVLGAAGCYWLLLLLLLLRIRVQASRMRPDWPITSPRAELRG